MPGIQDPLRRALGPLDVGGAQDRSTAPATPAPPPAALEVPFAPAAAPERPLPRPPSVELFGHGELYLAPSGYFVTEPGLEAPRSQVDVGRALARAARFIEDGENVFRRPEVTIAVKERALRALVAAFEGAGPGRSGGAVLRAKGYETEDQRLQVRAIAAPLVLDLVRSLDVGVPRENALRDRALKALLALVEAETHGLNRNFMIHDLDRVKAELPLDVRNEVELLMREVDPTRPPYDAWFARGNEKLRIEYHAAPGFFEDDLAAYLAEGFVRTGGDEGRAALARTAVENGAQGVIRTAVELLMVRGVEGLFARMDDPHLHVLVYSGHSSYGRHVKRALAEGAAAVGQKLFIGLQCGGKSVHNELLGRYPGLQVVQSRNASYGDEDRRLFLEVLSGLSKRLEWPAISAANKAANADNYYFPSDTLIRKRAEDLDGDGVADVWDRVVSYDAFHADAHVADQLAPQAPTKPAAGVGRALHGALSLFGRLASKNEWAEELQDQRFLGGGVFEGAPADPMFRVTPVEAGDGLPMFRVAVSDQYGHTDSHTLGAALHLELGRFTARLGGASDREASASGLLLAARFLDVDDAPLAREIFAALAAREGLPVALPEALVIAGEDRELPAGSKASVAQLLARRG